MKKLRRLVSRMILRWNKYCVAFCNFFSFLFFFYKDFHFHSQKILYNEGSIALEGVGTNVVRFNFSGRIRYANFNFHQRDWRNGIEIIMARLPLYKYRNNILAYHI